MTSVKSPVTEPVSVRVGPHGRVVIPAAMRRELGLEVGAELVAQVEDGRVVLEGRLANLRRWRDAWRAVLGDRSLADELVSERRAEAALEEAEASGNPDATAPAREALRRAAAG